MKKSIKLMAWQKYTKKWYGPFYFPSCISGDYLMPHPEKYPEPTKNGLGKGEWGSCLWKVIK